MLKTFIFCRQGSGEKMAISENHSEKCFSGRDGEEELFELPRNSGESDINWGLIRTLIAFEGNNGSKNQMDLLKIATALASLSSIRK
ncbi:hypothetical protein [Entomohabitans teleogrylli]|uniref:hypothetical protein n=1 Tax=Entomohabitans teleogrylli TaxID=1384589 RepID=UPI00073D4D6D|nr:hypothetical protein [Entomohabitans teleogrylli]